MGAFYALIAGEEYGADETPETLGLYRECYTIEFHPGKSWGSVCACSGQSDTRFSLYFPGLDYTSRETDNGMLMVEHHSGEREMDDDEYERRLWPADRLRPATGGRVFVAWTAGTGYVRRGGS